MGYNAGFQREILALNQKFVYQNTVLMSTLQEIGR